MPEFRVEWKENLNVQLGQLGIKDAFDPTSADLQFMLPNAENAFVKKVTFFRSFLLYSIRIRCCMPPISASTCLESKPLLPRLLR